MSTMQMRYEKTKQFITDEDVTLTEAIAHVYLWTMFEWSIIQRNRLAVRTAKLAKKLNANLDVIELRKSIKDL